MFMTFRKQPRLRLAIAFGVLPDSWFFDLSEAVSFARDLTSWLTEKQLNGVAFLLDAVTDAICSQMLVLVNVSFRLSIGDLA